MRFYRFVASAPKYLQEEFFFARGRLLPFHSLYEL